MSDWLGYTLEDFGNQYQIRGLVYGNGNEDILITLPEETPIKVTNSLLPTWEQWKVLLAQSDNPKMIIVDEHDRAVKAIIQKNTRQVQEFFRWGIFRRDNFTCQYCGATDKPLTIDEYLCQELGGPIDEANCKTACRPCNKMKANKTIAEWEQYRKDHGLIYGTQTT